VVAQITSGTAFDKHGRPFRRRNFVPGSILLAALAAVSLVVWLIAFNKPTEVEQAAACNAPPAPTDATQVALGERVTTSTMTEVVPAKLADTKIKVLNASGQGGQAAEVAGALVAAEAGARLRLPSGDDDEFIVAAAPGIADEFDAALRRVGAA